MAYSYTYIDGCRVEVHVAAAFNGLAADFLARTGCELHIRDATRTREEQWEAWRAYQNGGALAAYPGTSNHEEDGPIGPRALDLYDSGEDNGVTTIGTHRSNVLVEIAPAHGFTNAGHYFSRPEGWHYEYTGSLDGALPAALEANQRRAGAGGVRARREPTTVSPEVADAFLVEGEIGTFAGWVYGENVDGIIQWAKGAYSGLYFWTGGLTPMSLDGLPYLGDAPIAEHQRRADADGVKGRSDATTKAPQVTFLEPNEVGDFNGWKRGEKIDGEDRWLRGAHSAAWFWLGGLSPRSVDGLADLNGQGPAPAPTPTPTPTPEPKPEPTKPPTREDDPTVPGRWAGRWSDNREKRTGRVSYFIVHHAADTRPAEDQVKRFMEANDREVSPTWLVGSDGTAYKIVHPDDRQWTTGRTIDQQAVTVETQNVSGAPTWVISDESHETIAALVAWAAKRYGFPIDREHVLGHDEARIKLDPSIGATACPGPSMDLDRIVERAQEIANPPVPKPDDIPVSRSWLQSLRDAVNGLLGKAS
ncbi:MULTISPECIES: N-acetylmuramoyl-L-alanine amidase [Bacteria]|uniref:N-acetylmuramoyl-L-alanine amidase n=1 Tax=Bacteria TaxID=2 RepID=UPI003C7CB2B3